MLKACLDQIPESESSCICRTVCIKYIGYGSIPKYSIRYFSFQIQKSISCNGVHDLRRGIDGLVAIIHFQFELDPYDKNTLFLFCVRKSDRIKALLWEDDGFLLMYKRLDRGAFRSPLSADEAMAITKKQYHMLMQEPGIIAKHLIIEPKEAPGVM